MKKVFYLLLVSLSVLILASCVTIPDKPITDVEYTNIREIYDKEVSYLHDFNEESVELEVEFSDGTTKKYDHKNLTFNYNNFSNTKLALHLDVFTLNPLYIGFSKVFRKSSYSSFKYSCILSKKVVFIQILYHIF